MRDSVLIGTFIDNANISPLMVRHIVETFQSYKIFIFDIEDSEKKFLLTFNVKNVDKENKLQKYKKEYKNTVQLHRNKENNTLFTINSLNKVILAQGGSKERRSKVDWSDYKNSCVLLGNDGELKVLKTKLNEIIDIPN